MSTNRKSLAIVFGLSLLTMGQLSGAVEASASALPAGSSFIVPEQAVTVYQLTDSLSVEVKSLLNEATSDGLRIAATIRMKSNSSKVIKIPETDLRVTTADGYEYTLQASVFNAHAIRPNTTEELSYMATVDRKDQVSLTGLSWFSVDWYTYPKTETTLLNIPVSSNIWSGPLSEITEPEYKKTWGETFRIPNIDSPLVYTPVAVQKDTTQQGTVTTVKLLVENPSGKKETLPEFSLDGRTANQTGSDPNVFPGKRVEQGPISLDPQEQRYIHYTVAIEKDTSLASLNLLTTETFKQLDAKGTPTQTSYSVGRLNIALPSGGQSDISIEGNAYEYNTPFRFDALSDAIDPNMDVSLVEMHMHKNEGEGYQTVIGKFKLSNKGEQPLPLPQFQTKLVTESGLSYAGSRQTTTTQDIMPNTSYVISYSYIMPAEMKDRNFVLKLVDTKTAAPASTTIGAYRISLQTNTVNEDELSFYPFKVKMNLWQLSARTNMAPVTSPAPTTFSYKLKLDLDIERQEQVIVDQSFSKMTLELVDPTGKLLSVKTLSFTGVNRLVSGTQIIQFDNLKTDEQEYPLTVNIYESITTPTGEAKRLVGSIKE